MKIINGNKILDNIKDEIRDIIKNKNLDITLATILIGNDEASKLYINLKEKACKDVGINVEKFEFNEEINEDELIDKIKKLNKKVNGILIQLPVPNKFNKNGILDEIDYEKDVDGLTSKSLGKLILKDELNAPCTAKAVIRVLEENNISLEGKNVVLVGHGNVGKPLAMMLLNRNVSLDICNVFTKNLLEHTLNGDILISCTGVPNLIKKEMVKDGAVVIDIGINKKEGKVIGDVNDDVKEKTSLICQVPGGIGPVTIAMLLERLIK